MAVTLADLPDEGASETMFRLMMGITGAYTTIATVSWFILNTKDTIMSLADDIRSKTAKKKESLRKEGDVRRKQETARQIRDGMEAGQSSDEILRRLLDDME